MRKEISKRLRIKSEDLTVVLSEEHSEDESMFSQKLVIEEMILNTSQKKARIYFKNQYINQNNSKWIYLWMSF